MALTIKFSLGERVRHRLNDFQGCIIGIVIRDGKTKYEVLPVADESATGKSSVWIAEQYLVSIRE